MFLNSCCSLLHILHSEKSSANKLVSVHWGNLTMCSVSFGMYLQFYFYMSWLFTRYLTCIFESSVKIISHYAFFSFVNIWLGACNLWKRSVVNSSFILSIIILQSVLWGILIVFLSLKQSQFKLVSFYLVHHVKRGLL